MYVRNISGLNIYEDIRAFRLQGYPCISPNSTFPIPTNRNCRILLPKAFSFPANFSTQVRVCSVGKKLCGYFGLGSEVFRHISILGPILCFLGGTEFY